jgi:ABC-type phosphate transport system substrate-binding protein
MKTKFVTLLALVMLLSNNYLPMYASVEGDGYVMIVNDANPVSVQTASQVKLTYLRKINKRWKELNKNVVPVDNKGNSECRKSFLANVLAMSADDMGRFFTEREYQNAEAPPIKVDSDAAAIDYVENNPGAIAFVSKSSVKSGQKVKVVLEF